MFKSLTFSEAVDLYDSIRRLIPSMESELGEAGVECIVDALHLYAIEGNALASSTYDLDFAHLFALAYREQCGYDLKPDYSCLTSWSGAKYPLADKEVTPNEHDNRP